MYFNPLCQVLEGAASDECQATGDEGCLHIADITGDKGCLPCAGDEGCLHVADTTGVSMLLRLFATINNNCSN